MKKPSAAQLREIQGWLQANASSYDRGFDLAVTCSNHFNLSFLANSRSGSREIPQWVFDLAERAFARGRQRLDRLTVEVLFDRECAAPDFERILKEVAKDLATKRHQIAALEVLSGQTDDASWYVRIYA